MQLLMYVSAVMYPLALMRDKLPKIAWVVEYNPLAYIIETSRFMLLGTGTINGFGIAYTVIITFLILFSHYTQVQIGGLVQVCSY